MQDADLIIDFAAGYTQRVVEAERFTRLLSITCVHACMTHTGVPHWIRLQRQATYFFFVVTLNCKKGGEQKGGGAGADIP